MKQLNMKQNFALKQSGAALFISLIMLLVLTIIGLAASQRSSLQERMAANMHVTHITFNGAESALGAFFAEANEGSKLADGHILNELRLTGSIVNKQFDMDGTRVAAGYLDSNLSGGSLLATIDASILNDCDKTCGGYSFGGDVGCRYYQINGQGQLQKSGQVIQTAGTTVWAREITTCN